MTTPQAIYEQDIAEDTLLPDAAQAEAVLQLQRVYDDFLRETQRRQKAWVRLLRTLKLVKYRPIQGLYLWGSVGIGKTYLMDTFYDCLPTTRKLRLHFHRFMREVHEHLKQLQGERDPLKTVAARFAKQTDILCFDEFFVSDIGDAMILGNLLQALFDEGVSLVTTSNVVPDLLYRNGLQRELFLPAIACLKAYTQVYHVDTSKDYRLRELQRAGVYFCPLGVETRKRMTQTFERIARGPGRIGEVLEVEKRPIPTIRRASNVVWFEFVDLCHIPRSQNDYLEIAHRFQTVLVSGVPKIAKNEDNTATYLINLVDVFYDMNVKLILSAQVPIGELYLEGRKVFEFQRTQSRLLEMQSQEYLSRAHLE